MRNSLLIIGATVLLLDLAGADFALVRNNRPQCSIVLPEKPPKKVSLAVVRFNQALKTITGTALPVATTAMMPWAT